MDKRLHSGRRGAWNTNGVEPKLSDTYFNHRVYKAENRWQRREFIGKWRRIYAKDPRWVPPHAPSLRRVALDPAAHLVYVDALPTNPTYRGSSLESAVAAAIIRQDPTKRDIGYLSFLHTVNDRTTLRVLLESLTEHLRPHGIRTLIGPTHLFPHLGSGVLENYWNLTPPLYTPYNPPYLAELCQILMKRVEDLALYHLATDAQLKDVQLRGGSPATLSPFEPERLAGDLLPLLQVACSANPAFSPPNVQEAQRMMAWSKTSSLDGLLAEVDGTPVGFALLQPDLNARGTRRGLFSKLQSRGETLSGRLLFFAVLPEFRRRGIARHLLAQTLENAHARGWKTLSTGPVPRKTGKLEVWGGVPQQRYALYRYTL